MLFSYILFGVQKSVFEFGISHLLKTDECCREKSDGISMGLSSKKSAFLDFSLKEYEEPRTEFFIRDGS